MAPQWLPLLPTHAVTNARPAPCSPSRLGASPLPRPSQGEADRESQASTTSPRDNGKYGPRRTSTDAKCRGTPRQRCRSLLRAPVGRRTFSWRPGPEPQTAVLCPLRASHPVSPTFLRRSRGATLPVVLVLGAVLSGCHSVAPRSQVPARPDSTTVLWAGAVTDSSARVVARFENPQARVRLAVGRSGNGPDSMFVEGSRPATNQNVRH